MFRDMALKLRNWRHKFKAQLKILSNDTPETIWAKMREENIAKYDPLDLEEFLEKWCSKENKLGRSWVILLMVSFISCNSFCGWHVKNDGCVGVCCSHEVIANIEQYSLLQWDKKLCEGDTWGYMCSTNLLYTYRCKHLNMYVCVCVLMLFFFFLGWRSSYQPTLPHPQAWLKGRWAGHRMMHMPRCMAISPSMLAGFGKLGWMFCLCRGPRTHIIHPRRHDHRILGTPPTHKNMSTKQSREQSKQPSRLSGLSGRPVLEPLSH